MTRDRISISPASSGTAACAASDPRIAKLAEHWENVGKSLAKAVTAYNGAVGTLETRVLVTARRLKDKGVAAPEDVPDLETVDQTPRPLGAPQLTGLFDENGDVEPSESTRSR